MACIVVTDPIDPVVRRRLEAYADVIDLPEESNLTSDRVLEQADILVVRRLLSPDIIDAAPRLRAFVRHGVGVDFIPVDAASKHGIAVTNAPGVNANSVAEHALGMIIALQRHIANMDRGLRSGHWASLRQKAFFGRELGGQTIGVLGFGSVGRRIAAIARLGFGMRVLVHRQRAGASEEGITFCSLERLFEDSDIVVVACPLNDHTRGMVGRDLLGRLGPEGVLVNIGRGAILDEDALLDMLANGQLGGSALDVFTEEPLSTASAFRQLDNVVLTPHVAGISADSIQRMSTLAAADALRILRGYRPHYLINDHAWHDIEKRWKALGRPPLTA